MAVHWSESAPEAAARLRHAPQDVREAALSALREVKGLFVWRDVCAALEIA